MFIIGCSNDANNLNFNLTEVSDYSLNSSHQVRCANGYLTNEKRACNDTEKPINTISIECVNGSDGTLPSLQLMYRQKAKRSYHQFSCMLVQELILLELHM